MTPFKPLPIRTPVFKTGQRVAEAGSDQRFGTVLSITDAAHPVVEVRWDDLPERPTVHRPHSLRRAPPMGVAMSTKNRKNSAPGSISTSLALKSATDMVDQELFLALQERERRSELYDHRSSTVSDPVKAGQYARLAEIFATYAKNARDEIARRGLRSGLIIRKDGANLDCCSACGEPSPSFVVALGIGPVATVRLCPECAAHLSSTLDRLGSGLDR